VKCGAPLERQLRHEVMSYRTTTLHEVLPKLINAAFIIPNRVSQDPIRSVSLTDDMSGENKALST
jgi:hypothetical protein